MASALAERQVPPYPDGNKKDRHKSRHYSPPICTPFVNRCLTITSRIYTVTTTFHFIIAVAVLPLSIQPYGTLTDEWAQKPFFEEPDPFDRAANFTTSIELGVTFV